VVKKGFDRLVEACALLRDDLFAVDCDIIGEGPERSALERLVARRCLDTRVRLPGWSSGEKLQARYATAAICVIPSVVAPDGDRDNIPNVLAEAWASSVPTVVSATPAVSRLVGDSGAAILVPPGDIARLAVAIRNLCSDSDLARRVAAAGRELAVRAFDGPRNSERVRARLYESARSKP
jgi:glycosyltransferase involved in cell wall biosynthesis